MVNNKESFMGSEQSLTLSNWEYCLLGLTVLFIPIYPVIFISYLLFILSAKKGYKNFIVFFLLSIFIFLNTTRSIDNDLENYLTIYKFMNTSTLKGFFEDSNQFLVSFRLSEAMWYAITWSISNLTNANEFIYIGFLTCVIYGIYYYGLKGLVESIGGNTQTYILSILFGMLVCINFSETTHLIRQYICGSVLFLQFIWLFKKQYLKAFLILVPAILIHNSLIVPFFIMVVSYVIFTQKIIANKLIRVFFMPLIIGAVIGIFLNRFVSQYNYEVSDSAGGIFFSMALDVSTYIITLIFYFYSKNKRQINALVEGYLIFCLIFATCLFFLRSNMILYLRFYLYLEWFRVFGLIALISLFPVFKRSGIVLIGFVMFCFLFFSLRILRAPWIYGIDLVEVINKNLFQILKPIFNSFTT